MDARKVVCRAPNWGLTPDGRCTVCGNHPAAPAQAEPRDPVADCPYPHFAGRRVVELEEVAAKAVDRAIRAEAELAGLKAAAKCAAPAAQDGLLAKMRRLRDAISDLDGEELMYGDQIALANASRVACDYIRANEADHD